MLVSANSSCPLTQKLPVCSMVWTVCKPCTVCTVCTVRTRCTDVHYVQYVQHVQYVLYVQYVQCVQYSQYVQYVQYVHYVPYSMYRTVCIVCILCTVCTACTTYVHTHVCMYACTWYLVLSTSFLVQSIPNIRNILTSIVGFCPKPLLLQRGCHFSWKHKKAASD